MYIAQKYKKKGQDDAERRGERERGEGREREEKGKNDKEKVSERSRECILLL